MEFSIIGLTPPPHPPIFNLKVSVSQMTQNGLKHILNRSLKIMEFDIADPPPIMEFSIIFFFFLNEGFPNCQYFLCTP